MSPDASDPKPPRVPGVARTARSGFRHVAVCNDCNEQIENDRCKCSTPLLFTKGTLVSVWFPGEPGPRKCGEVARVGNGWVRLAQTADWYNALTGVGKALGTGTIRLFQPGDQFLWEQANAHREQLKLREEKRRVADRLLAEAADLQARLDHKDRALNLAWGAASRTAQVHAATTAELASQVETLGKKVRETRAKAAALQAELSAHKILVLPGSK